MVEMVPTELDRVRDHTAPNVNAQIDQRIAARIRQFATLSQSRASILELSSWTLNDMLSGVLRQIPRRSLFRYVAWRFCKSMVFAHSRDRNGVPVSPRNSRLVPAIAEIFRRMGKRARNEIDVEKFAMKALRGDFDGFNRTSDPAFAEEVIHAVAAHNRR